MSRSGYYQFLHAGASAAQQRREALNGQIQRIYQAHAGRYGAPRITAELQDHGTAVNRKTVARLMQRTADPGGDGAGLRRRRTTDSKHSLPIAANLLAAGLRAAACPTPAGWRTSLTCPRLKDGFTWRR